MSGEAKQYYEQKIRDLEADRDGFERECNARAANIDKLREELKVMHTPCVSLDRIKTDELDRLRGSVALAEHHIMLALNALKEIT